MNINALIEELAKEVGVGEAALKKWRQRGVSYRRREEIRELAEKRGVVIPRSAFDDFGRTVTAAPPREAEPGAECVA